MSPEDLVIAKMIAALAGFIIGATLYALGVWGVNKLLRKWGIMR